MAYTKTNWVNDTTPINATNLNNIENGIKDNETLIGDLTTLDTSTQTDLVSAINEVNSLETTKTYCRYGTSSNVTLTNANTEYKIPLNIQQYNNGFSVSNGAIICPKDGVICISCASMMGTYNGYAGLKIKLNGIQIFDVYATKPSVNYGEIVSPVYTFLIKTNDTIELYATSGSANDMVSNSTRTGVNIFYI